MIHSRQIAQMRTQRRCHRAPASDSSSLSSRTERLRFSIALLFTICLLFQSHHLLFTHAQDSSTGPADSSTGAIVPASSSGDTSSFNSAGVSSSSGDVFPSNTSSSVDGSTGILMSSSGLTSTTSPVSGDSSTGAVAPSSTGPGPNSSTGPVAPSSTGSTSSGTSSTGSNVLSSSGSGMPDSSTNAALTSSGGMSTGPIIDTSTFPSSSGLTVVNQTDLSNSSSTAGDFTSTGLGPTSPIIVNPVSSSTGVFNGTLGANALTTDSTDVKLFLIIGGCVAGGVSVAVGVFACWCQQRERARKKLMDLQKKEREKAKQLERSGTKKKNKKGKKLPPLVENADSAGAVAVSVEEQKDVYGDGGASEDVSPMFASAGGDGDGSVPVTIHDTPSADPAETWEDIASPTSFANADEDRKKSDLSLANEAALLAQKRAARVAKRERKAAKAAAKAAGQEVSTDESAADDDEFDSDEEDMKYNRHEHIQIEMTGIANPIGETSLELNSDYSNLVYDPHATAAAAEELARLTGQSIEEVTAMLQQQQEEEIARGGEEALAAARAVVEHALQQETSGMAVGSAASSSMDFTGGFSGTSSLYDTPAVAPTAASVTYDELPPIQHPISRTYDDLLLAYHGALDRDPYLLSVYQPSHAATPSLVPPPKPVPPHRLPKRMPDTKYGHPIAPPHWRLVHGHRPRSQSISFAVDYMPRWWKYYKGLDVSETAQQLRQVKLGAARVARKPKKQNFVSASSSMPVLSRATTLRGAKMPSMQERASNNKAAQRWHSAVAVAQVVTHPVSKSLKPTRLQGNTPPQTQRQDITQIVRDAPPPPNPEPETYNMGDLTDRHHRRGDEEERRGGSTYQRDDETESLGLMGGGGDGSNTYRGYSRFQLRDSE